MRGSMNMQMSPASTHSAHNTTLHTVLSFYHTSLMLTCTSHALTMFIPVHVTDPPKGETS